MKALARFLDWLFGPPNCIRLNNRDEMICFVSGQIGKVNDAGSIIEGVSVTPIGWRETWPGVFRVTYEVTPAENHSCHSTGKP